MPDKISGEQLHQWRQWAVKQAQTHNIDPGEVDWLLQGITSLKSLSLRLDNYRTQPGIDSDFSLAELTTRWQRRIDDRVPVQYLVGETPWRNFSLTVSADVLIPRPETELIINIAKDLAAQSPIADRLCVGNWADLGTGSGAITLGLADTFPKATIHAVDISSQALEIAQHNAQKNQLSHRINFHKGSWLSPLSPLKGQLTGIVSNPPYIPTQTVHTLQPEIANNEPHLALDGGADGLDCIKILIASSLPYLCPNGIWLAEVMTGQAEIVTHLLRQQGSYTHITIHKDLSGIDRFVSARKAL